jgi:hypothetical protein
LARINPPVLVFINILSENGLFVLNGFVGTKPMNKALLLVPLYAEEQNLASSANPSI